ncbi:hypothetical protein M2305_002676 [Gluconobacter cerinus]|nr:hypothetical protein [Gluconobacter cerinus]
MHWAKPCRERSKLIERARRDLARHPRFAGAYPGNTVLAKPKNYESLEVKVVHPLRSRPLISGANALALDFDEDAELEREAEEMAEVMQLRDYF